MHALKSRALTSDVTAYTNEEDGAAKYLAKHFLAELIILIINPK